MSQDEMRAAILERIRAGNGQCNRYYLAHLDGTIRGLLWALTGTDPGTTPTEDIAAVFDAAGIPYTRRATDLAVDWDMYKSEARKAA